MKILIVSHYWFPEPSVPQRRWSWLTGVLTNAGHQVTVVCPASRVARDESTGDSEFGPSGERIVRVAGSASGSSLTARALRQGSIALLSVGKAWVGVHCGKIDRPDLVLGTVPAIPSTFATYGIAKILKAPYGIDIRDAWPDLLKFSDSWNASIGENSLREKILRLGPLNVFFHITERMMGRVFAKADFLIATSDKFATVLRRRYPEGPRVATVRNAFPTPHSRKNMCSTSGGGNRLKILYAGKVGRAQDLQNAIRAVRMVEDRGVPVEMRVVGSGAALPAIKELAAQLDASVEFFQQVDATQLSDHYDWASTALVHLADWYPLEMAVPSKTYELLKVGLHITAVAAGETADLVASLKAGTVVAPADSEALADAWINLWRNMDQFSPTEESIRWVSNQEKSIGPQTLLSLLEDRTE